MITIYFLTGTPFTILTSHIQTRLAVVVFQQPLLPAWAPVAADMIYNSALSVYGLSFPLLMHKHAYW
jgi:hypothetical protein